jgi:hypothetical protein
VLDADKDAVEDAAVTGERDLVASANVKVDVGDATHPRPDLERIRDRLRLICAGWLRVERS